MKTLSLLMVRAIKPLYFVVEDQYPLEDQSLCEYMIEEKLCPMDVIHMDVRESDDLDPHGVFEHILTVPMPDGYGRGNLDTHEDWEKLFPGVDWQFGEMA